MADITTMVIRFEAAQKQALDALEELKKLVEAQNEKLDKQAEEMQALREEVAALEPKPKGK